MCNNNNVMVTTMKEDIYVCSSSNLNAEDYMGCRYTA